MNVDILGIDWGKNSCSVVGLDSTGRVVLRRRMRRESIVPLAAKLSGCVVAMEACCGAHHIGRLLAAQGHEVWLMSPEYVRPYVKARSRKLLADGAGHTFTQPAASDGPDDKPTTASIAVAATSIDFITISFRVAHWLGGDPSR